MERLQARVLVVDGPEQHVSRALHSTLRGHEVVVARDAFDAIQRIDAADPSYDLILCDLASPEVPGLELWAYLKLTEAAAARRMVFVVSEGVSEQERSFLETIPNACVQLANGGGGVSLRREAAGVRKGAPSPEFITGGMECESAKFAVGR